MPQRAAVAAPRHTITKPNDAMGAGCRSPRQICWNPVSHAKRRPLPLLTLLKSNPLQGTEFAAAARNIVPFGLPRFPGFAVRGLPDNRGTKTPARITRAGELCR